MTDFQQSAPKENRTSREQRAERSRAEEDRHLHKGKRVRKTKETLEREDPEADPIESRMNDSTARSQNSAKGSNKQGKHAVEAKQQLPAILPSAVQARNVPPVPSRRAMLSLIEKITSLLGERALERSGNPSRRTTLSKSRTYSRRTRQGRRRLICCMSYMGHQFPWPQYDRHGIPCYPWG